MLTFYYLLDIYLGAGNREENTKERSQVSWSWSLKLPSNTLGALQEYGVAVSFGKGCTQRIYFVSSWLFDHDEKNVEFGLRMNK